MAKLILFLSCVMAVIADMMLVWYAKHTKSSIWIFVSAIILSVVGIFVWQYSMRKGIESATAITVYCILTTIGCTILGQYFFGEILIMKQWVGIGLAIVALLMINT
jgi:multidrug transporter EmrE-like cation transporter